MKKLRILSVITVCLALTALVFIACEEPIDTFTVTFNANGGDGAVPNPITVNAGSGITIPSGNGLAKNGYVFGGWNTNSAGTGTNYSAGSSLTPAGSIILYVRWLPNSAGITLNIKQIEDGAPIIAAITISRTGSNKTCTVSVSNPSDYSNISWEVAGIGAYAGETVTGNDASFTLNAGEIKYNSLGGHVLILTVTKVGMQYQRAIPFTIVQ